MNDEKSYERYKQYRLNKYRYEQEQITFPLAIILIGAAIIGLWKYIVIAIAVACAIAVIFLLVYLYLKKQLTKQPIVLTKEQAKDGVNATVNISYKNSRATVCLDIPANVQDGEKFVVKNVLFKDVNGKILKKNVHLVIKTS